MKKREGPDPIHTIMWRHFSELTANFYNPNVVYTPELKLLELNIIALGWVQPILVSPAGVIIDGFHRWRLAQDSQEIREIYAGKVPCATLNVSEADAMMITIRMNRAKGTHVAVRLSEIVKSLMNEHNLSPEAVMEGIGATRDEVDLLYQDSIFEAKGLQHYRYSRAWVPMETRGTKAAGARK